MSDIQKKGSSALKAVSLALGLAAIVAAIAFFAWRVVSQKHYIKKWQDWEETGI